MATQEPKSGWGGFFADAASSEKLRQQFMEAPLAGAQQEALGIGQELADLLAVLPAAFVDSQRRELARVQREQLPNDPRVAAIQISIDQARELQATARSGAARVERTVAAMSSTDEVFHGFVSGPDLAPAKGLTIRLTDPTGGKRLSATTADDGYFHIVLGKSGEWRGAAGKAARAKSAEADMHDESASNTAGDTGTGGEQSGITVEILRRGTQIYTDPEPVVRDGQSLYREYFISGHDTEPQSTADIRKFMKQQPSKPPAAAKTAPTKKRK